MSEWPKILHGDKLDFALYLHVLRAGRYTKLQLSRENRKMYSPNVKKTEIKSDWF